jgi:bifunctional non-homologous end joining protein LigD
VSKLRNAPYRSGRTEAWIKTKCLQTARYEVIGYKNGATSLYLAKRDGKDLVYVGKAGTDFTNSMILELAHLMKLITLAEVEYRDITSDGLLRHTTFRGLYASRTAKKPLVAKFK